jgi:hypothetical protein
MLFVRKPTVNAARSDFFQSLLMPKLHASAS